jgi:hypothetical protein
MKKLLLIVTGICLLHVCHGQTITINSRTGNDANNGSADHPLRTLQAGIEKVNHYSGNGPLTVQLEPGLYPLNANLTIAFNKNFTAENRLTIEAAIMPDDSLWSQETMPTIISTSVPQDFGGDTCTFIFNVEADHVTIRGLKFLGNPSINTKHFCIYRTGDTLTDLKVSQCMFLGDQDALPVQVGVLSNGHHAEIDHCVFSNCRWAVILFYAENWSVPIKGGSIHHCIMTDCYGGALWTSLVGSDLKFYNNIVGGCNYFWIKNYNNTAEYTIENCIVTGNNVYNGEWRKDDGLGKGNYDFHEKNILKRGAITLVKWNERFQSAVDRNFLHASKGSSGYDLHAGIFLQ